MANNRWTEEDVQNIVNNPIYVGLGPFPRIIDDDSWIKAQAPVVKEKGLKRTLENIRKQLQGSVGREVESISYPGWVEESTKKVEAEGMDKFFRELMAQLRTELG